MCIKCAGIENLTREVLVDYVIRHQTKEILMDQEDQTPNRKNLDGLINQTFDRWVR